METTTQCNTQTPQVPPIEAEGATGVKEFNELFYEVVTDYTWDDEFSVSLRGLRNPLDPLPPIPTDEDFSVRNRVQDPLRSQTASRTLPARPKVPDNERGLTPEASPSALEPTAFSVRPRVARGNSRSEDCPETPMMPNGVLL